MHLLKGVISALFKYNLRNYNRYGYSVAIIEKENGRMNGKIVRKKYFLMNKKIYARRFLTDCFSDYFNDITRNTNIGLDDYIEYATERATVDELRMQNSYFIDALYSNTGSTNS